MKSDRNVLVLLDLSDAHKDVLSAAIHYAHVNKMGLDVYHALPKSVSSETTSDIKRGFEQDIDEVSDKLSVKLNSSQVYIANEIMPSGPFLNKLIENSGILVMGGGNAYNNEEKREKIIKIIDSNPLPVLVIPENGNLSKIERILFCSSYQNLSSHGPLLQLKKIAQSADAEVRVAHVKTRSGSPKEIKIDQSRFEGKFLEPEVKYAYKLLKNRDVISGINHYIKKKGDNDLVVMIRRSHNIIDRIFGPNFTHKMLEKTEIPLLILKENQLN